MALAAAAEPAEGLDSDDGNSSASEGEEEDNNGRNGDFGAGPSQFESRKRAASTALALGDGIGAEGRYRDKDNFISLVRCAMSPTKLIDLPFILRLGPGPLERMQCRHPHSSCQGLVNVMDNGKLCLSV